MAEEPIDLAAARRRKERPTELEQSLAIIDLIRCGGDPPPRDAELASSHLSGYALGESVAYARFQQAMAAAGVPFGAQSAIRSEYVLLRATDGALSQAQPKDGA